MFGIEYHAKRHPHPAPTKARQEADLSLRNLPPSRGKEAHDEIRFLPAQNYSEIRMIGLTVAPLLESAIASLIASSG